MIWQVISLKFCEMTVSTILSINLVAGANQTSRIISQREATLSPKRKKRTAVDRKQQQKLDFESFVLICM